MFGHQSARWLPAALALFLLLSANAASVQAARYRSYPCVKSPPQANASHWAINNLAGYHLPGNNMSQATTVVVLAGSLAQAELDRGNGGDDGTGTLPQPHDDTCRCTKQIEALHARISALLDAHAELQGKLKEELRAELRRHINLEFKHFKRQIELLGQEHGHEQLATKHELELLVLEWQHKHELLKAKAELLIEQSKSSVNQQASAFNEYKADERSRIDERWHTLDDKITNEIDWIKQIGGLLGFLATVAIALLSWLGYRKVESVTEKLVQPIVEKTARDAAQLAAELSVEDAVTGAQSKVADYLEEGLIERVDHEIKRIQPELERRIQRLVDITERGEELLSIIEGRATDTDPNITEEAAQLAKEISELKDPSDYSSKDWYVKGLGTNNQYEKIRFYLEAIRGEPRNARAYNNLGSAYHRVDRYKDALAAFTKAIELNPDYALAHFNLGSTYSSLLRYEDAQVALTKGIALQPLDADAYSCRGNAYIVLKRYDKALADCNKAIELEPNNHAHYYNRGNLFNDQKQYKEALADYGRAIELKPDDASAYENSAEIQIIISKYLAAIETLSSSELDKSKPEERGTCAWLTCVATAASGKDTSSVDAELQAVMQTDFEHTFDTKPIEQWVETADLADEIKDYIRRITKQFKSKLRSGG